MNRDCLIAIALLIALAGCQKRESAGPSRQPTNIDACSLITGDEVQKIVGSPVKDTKPSSSSDDNFRLSQCFYSTETFNHSISLAVTERNPQSQKARDPKALWKETFARFEAQPEEHEGDKEKKQSLEREDEDEGKGQPPKKIEGVGDAAWWTANRVGGALYVLKGNVMLRIGIGGTETDEGRLDRAKALAAKALSRL
jgi:hypothetical protein